MKKLKLLDWKKLTLTVRSIFNHRLNANFLHKDSWHLNTKAKFAIVFAIIAIMLISIFAFLPKGQQSPYIIEPQGNDPTASPSPTPTNQQTPGATKKPETQPQIIHTPRNPIIQFIENIIPRTPGVVEAAQTVNNEVWTKVAQNAWQYFQPGTGVDSTSGLPGAVAGYPYFTDWDLGIYIQAVIDAEKIGGLVSRNGPWGSDDRLNRVLTFLENRELNAYGYPYWFYKADDGKKWKDLPEGVTVDTVDTGTLLVALYNVKSYNSSWGQRVDNFVYNRFSNRSNYAAIVPSVKADSEVTTSIYAYFMASGFANFWPTELANAPNKILDNIYKSGNATTYGVQLPKGEISSEPLLCSVFSLPRNQRLMDLARTVYQAHEARNKETGQIVAFSEGNAYGSFIYEWVVLPSGETWVVKKDGQPFNINPIIYTKVAFSFLALYNTTYARNATVYIEQSLPEPTKGYSEGADYNANGAPVTEVQVGGNTNGLILGAARYALQK